VKVKIFISIRIKKLFCIVRGIPHRFYEHQQRVKKSGGAAAKLTSRSVRWRIPMLPRMSGFGPIAWRQLTSVIRQSKGILIVLGILVA
jgi:hypothetical protein